MNIRHIIKPYIGQFKNKNLKAELLRQEVLKDEKNKK